MSIAAIGTRNVLETFDPCTQGSDFFDVGSSSLVSMGPYTTHIQVALCYLLQQRTGGPIVLLSPDENNIRRRSRDVNRVVRMRRFTCEALLRLSPSIYIETLFHDSVLLPSSDATGDRPCWIAQALNHEQYRPLRLSRNEIEAWRLNWERSTPVNAWLHAILTP
jgi:hypothetical protein